MSNRLKELRTQKLSLEREDNKALKAVLEAKKELDEASNKLIKIRNSLIDNDLETRQINKQVLLRGDILYKNVHNTKIKTMLGKVDIITKNVMANNVPRYIFNGYKRLKEGGSVFGATYNSDSYPREANTQYYSLTRLLKSGNISHGHNSTQTYYGTGADKFHAAKYNDEGFLHCKGGPAIYPVNGYGTYVYALNGKVIAHCRSHNKFYIEKILSNPEEAPMHLKDVDLSQAAEYVLRNGSPWT